MFALVLSVFVVAGVGGVIDGNVDGIWWQVLAVAFRRHWAVGGQVLAADGLPSLFQPRCDTRRLGLVAPGYEALWLCVEWNNKQRCHHQHMMICTAQGHRAKAWQGGKNDIVATPSWRVLANWDVTTSASWFHSSARSQQPLN